jgi:small subunit ribosomal protein S4
LGERVFSKTQTTKFTVSGTEQKQRGKKGKKTLSEYGSQLIEKQKARYTYGVTEKQFSSYVKKARAIKGGNPVNDIYSMLERRLDNTVYRLGLAKSRALARQMVSHGHITMNGRKVTIPSAVVSKGDVIAVRKGSQDKALFKDLAENNQTYTVPNWLTFDLGKKEGVVKTIPAHGEGETNLNFGTILEFYSRV